MNEANFNTLFPESNIVLFYFTVIFCDGKQQTKHKKRIFSFYKTLVLLSSIASVVWRTQTLKTFSFKQEKMQIILVICQAGQKNTAFSPGKVVHFFNRGI